MIKKLASFIALAVLFVTPTVASAAVPTDFRSLIAMLQDYIRLLIPFIIGLTVLVFLWGLFKMVFAGDSSKAVEEGRKFITYGIVTLFVMVSVWGLVKILSATFFGNQFFVPQLRTSYIEHSFVNKV